VEPWARPVGVAILLGGLLAFGGVLNWLRAHAKVTPLATTQPWWGYYLYDLANLLAVALFSAALLLEGFHPPIALLGAFGTSLAVYLLDYALGHAAALSRGGWLAGVGGVLFALPLAFFPTQAQAALEIMVARLF
jgi:hypothetical protein